MRNIVTCKDNCNVRENRNRFVGSIRYHNHEMKEIFKGAATRASCGVGPLRDFYVGSLAKGMKPEMSVSEAQIHRSCVRLRSELPFVSSQSNSDRMLVWAKAIEQSAAP